MLNLFQMTKINILLIILLNDYLNVWSVQKKYFKMSIFHFSDYYYH